MDFGATQPTVRMTIIGYKVNTILAQPRPVILYKATRLRFVSFPGYCGWRGFLRKQIVLNHLDSQFSF